MPENDNSMRYVADLEIADNVCFATATEWEDHEF